MKQEELYNFLIAGTATLVEAMQKIDLNTKGILFVTDKEEKLAGVITDGDIRRWLIKTGNLQEEIWRIMNKNPKIIYCKERNRAQEFIEKFVITALPVVTTEYRIIDIIFKEEKDAGEKPEERDTLKEVPVVIMAGGKVRACIPIQKSCPSL